ncbi:(2Fe-2S)-binding protein [Paraburkholderia sp.]|uniref:(2Fe-2S)-binding protein n=1 Tax=Paraburkholderia sp. TaxID=1926495 RepID=UPI002F418C21
MPSVSLFAEAGAPRREPQFVRLAETRREPLHFFVDGEQVAALQGDTLLSAVLMHQRHLRESEFSGAPRAGFCLIGACQDCWMRAEDGTRVRACSTLVTEGMRVLTRAAAAQGGATGKAGDAQ